MLAGLRKLLSSKKLCFAACSEGFTAERVQQAKCDAELEAEEPAETRDDVNRIPKNCPHPQLYERLVAWRSSISKEKDLMEQDIVPNLSLKEMASSLPTTKRGLNNIRGIGKGRFQKYGEDLMRIVSAYCQENQIASTNSSDSQPNAADIPTPRPSKSQTKNITLQMFRDGQTVEEIAKARSLSISTIEGHLGHFVEMGELDIKLLLDEESLGEISHYLNTKPDSTLGQSKEHFGDKYSYGQLRLAYAAWQTLAE
jgi:DNA-binding CsgD family transcriptional regulator